MKRLYRVVDVHDRPLINKYGRPADFQTREEAKPLRDHANEAYRARHHKEEGYVHFRVARGPDHELGPTA